MDYLAILIAALTAIVPMVGIIIQQGNRHRDKLELLRKELEEKIKEESDKREAAFNGLNDRMRSCVSSEQLNKLESDFEKMEARILDSIAKLNSIILEKFSSGGS